MNSYRSIFLSGFRQAHRLALLLILFVATPVRASEISAIHKIETAMQEGYTAFEKGDIATAVKQFIEARALSEQNHDYGRQCLASYNLGTSYYQLMGYSEALDYYFEALELCDRHKLPTSRRLEILYGISGVFYEHGNYPKAKEITVKVYNIARSISDSLMIENSAFALALIDNKLGQFKNTGRYLDIASRYGKTVSLRRDIVEAEAYFLQKDYDKLKTVLQRALTNRTLNGPDLGFLYFYQAETALHENDLKLSFMAKDKALPLLNPEEKAMLYFDLSSKCEAIGDKATAMAYKDSAIFFLDSLNRFNNDLLVKNADTRYGILRFRIEKEHEISELRSRTRFWIATACGGLLLVVIAWMTVVMQRQRSRHREQIMNMQMERRREQQLLAEERMKETELIAGYQQKLMQKEIERKNAELSASSMFVSSRNNLIRDLLKYIGKIDGANAAAEIRQVTGHLNRLLDDSCDEETFRINFDAANPGFSSRLLERHPDLLPGDIRFLAYVRMNMPTKDIASMLNINPDSCKRRKNRLAKKLGLESSADLYAYVLNITENGEKGVKSE